MAQRIAIVGGGIAGLTAGVYARRAGFDTDIFEKNPVPGGECTGWDRGDCHIDNCIHWMMGTRPGSALNGIWRATGALGPGVDVIASDRMYTSELNGQSITLWKDPERTYRELLELSPQDAGPIDELMSLVALSRNVQVPADKPPELMNLFDAIKLSLTMSQFLQLRKRCVNMDNADMQERFQHPLIRAMLADFCTRESLATSFPMAYGNFVGGDGGVPRGGSRAMALRMAKRFTDLGGILHLSSPATHINVDGARAVSLSLEGGDVFDFDYIICACDASFTFGSLLDERYMSPLMREMFANPAAYPIYGMFQTAFVVDSTVDALGGDIMLPCDELRFNKCASNRLTVRLFAHEPSFAPPGKLVLQTMQGMSDAGYDYWLSLSQSPSAYRQKKTILAQSTQSLLERRFPEYSGKLTFLDAWTPLTYSRWCNAYKGYNQSFTITKSSSQTPYPPAQISALDNAYLAGQWISPPGGLPGAATTGKFAVQRILHALGRSIKI